MAGLANAPWGVWFFVVRRVSVAAWRASIEWIESAAASTSPTLTYDSHGNVNSTFAYTPGTQNQIVVLRLMYLWPTVTGPFGLNLTNQPGNQRLMYATSVFTTESYG